MRYQTKAKASPVNPLHPVFLSKIRFRVQQSCQHIFYACGDCLLSEDTCLFKQPCRRGEMADARDLKSLIPKGVCGFESRRRHITDRNSFPQFPRMPLRLINAEAYILCGLGTHCLKNSPRTTVRLRESRKLMPQLEGRPPCRPGILAHQRGTRFQEWAGFHPQFEFAKTFRPRWKEYCFLPCFVLRSNQLPGQ